MIYLSFIWIFSFQLIQCNKQLPLKWRSLIRSSLRSIICQIWFKYFSNHAIWPQNNAILDFSNPSSYKNWKLQRITHTRMQTTYQKQGWEKQTNLSGAICILITTHALHIYLDNHNTNCFSLWYISFYINYLKGHIFKTITDYTENTIISNLNKISHCSFRH